MNSVSADGSMVTSQRTVEKYNVLVTKYCTAKKRRRKKNSSKDSVQIYTVRCPLSTIHACTASETNGATLDQNKVMMLFLIQFFIFINNIDKRKILANSSHINYL